MRSVGLNQFLVHLTPELLERRQFIGGQGGQRDNKQQHGRREE
jgi:hypothetical protein